MPKDPFQPKIEHLIKADWKAGRFLDYDQSSVDPRFDQSFLDEEKLTFNHKYLLTFLVLVGLVFFVRLFGLQIINYKNYLSLAEGNRLRIQYLLAPRGLIYDNFGTKLVVNEPSFELIATPLDLPKDPEALSAEISKISAFFALNEPEVTALIKKSNPTSFFPVTLKQNVDKERAVVFVTQEQLFPGFSLENNPQRAYIDPLVYAHVLGYTGKLVEGEHEKLKDEGYLYNDIIGKEGIESSYEKFLRGTPGQRLVEVDVKGVVKNTFQQKPALPGDSLTLYLDAGLQKVLYDSLSKQIANRRAKRAAAVAIDPTTGGVLAMVSLPSYDNNLFSKGISSADYSKLITDPDFPLFNRVTSGTYPPGSTVKPFLAAGALQEGVITEKTKITDTGKLVVPNQFNPALSQTFRGWKPEGLGVMDVYSAIAMSSDIYFYTVGGGQKILNIDGLGAQKVADYFKAFYLGHPTGIDLPTEKSGLVPTPDWKEQHFYGDKINQKWYLGDTYNMSIGQGFMLVSPLQLTLATAAVANGGSIMRPRLVKTVTQEDGKAVQTYQPEILSSNFIDKKYLDIVRAGMRQTVTGGTAGSLAAISMPIAGKTGTSQFEGSDLSKTHAWFTSYAPADNPKIVLTVLVEAGGEGSGAAVPVAKDVYEWYSKNRM